MYYVEYCNIYHFLNCNVHNIFVSAIIIPDNIKHLNICVHISFQGKLINCYKYIIRNIMSDAPGNQTRSYSKRRIFPIKVLFFHDFFDKGQTFDRNFSLCLENNSRQREKKSAHKHCNFVSSQNPRLRV